MTWFICTIVETKDVNLWVIQFDLVQFRGHDLIQYQLLSQTMIKNNGPTNKVLWFIDIVFFFFAYLNAKNLCGIAGNFFLKNGLC